MVKRFSKHRRWWRWEDDDLLRMPERDEFTSNLDAAKEFIRPDPNVESYETGKLDEFLDEFRIKEGLSG